MYIENNIYRSCDTIMIIPLKWLNEEQQHFTFNWFNNTIYNKIHSMNPFDVFGSKPIQSNPINSIQYMCMCVNWKKLFLDLISWIMLSSMMSFDAFIYNCHDLLKIYPFHHCHVVFFFLRSSSMGFVCVCVCVYFRFTK